ncbi:3-oxoacyl-ACP reductase FabG [Rickettsiales bacterium]|nr:3-oxoacyl-ACP reductase FabG [Rickettsiales bacterium]
MENNINFSFKNSKVLITGAAGGIGSAITSAFLKAGATVCTSSTTQEKADQLVEKFSEHKDQIHTQVCNLGEVSQVEQLVPKAVEAMGGLDILICNAGMNINALSIRTKTEDFQKLTQINLTSDFILNRDAIKVMLKKKYGRIVNVSSVLGIIGNAGQCAYSASKAGLIGLTKSLAMEVAAKGITVNAIAPGYTKTAMTKTASEKAEQAIVSQIPAGYQADPSEIANVILFAASKEASYVTGTVLNPSGGMVRN